MKTKTHMEDELYKKAQAEFDAAFREFAQLSLEHLRTIEEDRLLYYIESRAKEGLQQHQTESLLKDIKWIKEKLEENKDYFKNHTSAKDEKWDIIVKSISKQNTSEDTANKK
jgi:hypothetical protein